MTVTIGKSIARGEVTPPASKSILHRAIICNALSGGNITGNNACDDISATRRCLSLCSFDGKALSALGTLDCGESATTLRLLMPLLMNGSKTVFACEPSLLARPMDVYKAICKHYTNSSGAISICDTLSAGEYIIDGSISSQFASGLMLALPLKDGDSVIRFNKPLVSKSYVTMTAAVMSAYGVCAKVFDDRIEIKGNQTYNACDYVCECDESSAAYIGAFGFVGGDVNVSGRQKPSLQGDSVWNDIFQTLCKQNATIDVTNTPDLAPIIMALAALKNGATLLGTHRLGYKESDRVMAMRDELAKVLPDMRFVIGDDSVQITPGRTFVSGQTIDSHGDHRIAMAMSLLLSLCGGNIAGAECVDKSYPSFFNDLKSLGIEVRAL